MATRKPITKTALPVKPNDYGAMVDYLEGHIGVMKHMAHFLLGKIEWDFDHSRGILDKHGGITLTFRVEGIDASTWLIGELWGRLADLDQLLLDFANASAVQNERGAA